MLSWKWWEIFKFYRNVVRFTTIRDGPFTERKPKGEDKGKKHLHGQISKSSWWFGVCCGDCNQGLQRWLSSFHIRRLGKWTVAPIALRESSLRKCGKDDHESAELEEPKTPEEEVQEVPGPERWKRDRKRLMGSTEEIFTECLPCGRHSTQSLVKAQCWLVIRKGLTQGPTQEAYSL